MANLGRSVYQVAYELSPIILSGGLFKNSSITGGLMPLVAITQAGNFGASLLSGNSPLDPNQFFGHFRPLPGSTLIDNDIALYPFANQNYAANATIAKPLKISMLMTNPVNVKGGYVSKLITFTALQALLNMHIQAGGTFIVATPSYVYLDCVLTNLVDVSRPDSQQPQNAWQFDFMQPLISTKSSNVLSRLMSSFSSAAVAK